MRSGGATSTHALTPSCSQRSPSLRPVEPVSAMPWPRRLPRLSAHAPSLLDESTMVHPLRGSHHRVGAEGPKRGCRWRTYRFCFGVARRPRVLPVRRNHPVCGPDAPDQWGARGPRRSSLQACRNTVAPSNDVAGLRDQGGRYPTAPQELRLALAGGRGFFAFPDVEASLHPRARGSGPAASLTADRGGLEPDRSNVTSSQH